MEAFFLLKNLSPQKTLRCAEVNCFDFLVYIKPVSYAIRMNKSIFVLICLLLSISVTAETVYKKTNPDGSVEFSDIDTKDSEEIKIRKPIIIPAPRLPAASSHQKAINYEVTIIEPANDTTLIGSVEIKVLVSVSPKLFSGHQFRYQLGEQSIDTHSNSARFKNVVRGTHVVRVSVIDQKGERVSEGASQTFHLKRFIKKTKPTIPKPKTP